MRKRIKEDDRYELFDRLDEIYREMNLLIAEIAKLAIGRILGEYKANKSKKLDI